MVGPEVEFEADPEAGPKETSPNSIVLFVLSLKRMSGCPGCGLSLPKSRNGRRPPSRERHGQQTWLFLLYLTRRIERQTASTIIPYLPT